MPDHTFSDKLLNSFNAKAQDWGAATENEQLQGRALLRRRDAYYKALRELTEYVRGLERSIKEGEADFDSVVQEKRRFQDDLLATEVHLRQVQLSLLAAEADVERLSKEITSRNVMREKGPDEIGKDYILRLGIPALTDVFFRTVLGQEPPQ